VSHPRRTRRSREKDQRLTAQIHQTVRCANDRQHQRSAAQSSRDTWSRQRSVGHTRLSGVHQTVSSAPTDPRDQQSAALHMERNQAPDMNSSCPVVHRSTEGKIGLPSWSPTAPSCLGAIKGTPRCMEEYTKHSLSILKHPDFAPAYSLHCVSDLGFFQVVHSMSCHLSSSLHLCAWLCCVFESCVCCFSQPYSLPSL
jgi:hypothetical protein